MKLLRVKNPEHSIEEFQDEMNRMIQNAFEDLGILESRRSKYMIWRPAVELNEKENEYQLKAELPGIDKNNIEIEIGEDAITLKAKSEHREEEKTETVCKSEFKYGQFLRTIPFPSTVDNKNAKAEYKNGILIITVPKSQEEQEKIRKINVE